MTRPVMSPFQAWVAAARPKTLTAAIVPVAAGSALAYAETRQHLWWITLCALLSAVCIQIGTNLINDAIDFKKGADTESRLGPPRMTQMGLISPSAMLKGASTIFILALLSGFLLVLHGGFPILIIGAASLFFGYGYTAGPYPLAYHGLGEIFVVVFFGVIAVGGMYFLQTESYSISALVLGLQIGLLAALIIEVNNYRDIDNDSAAHKHTLAVRVGQSQYLRIMEITTLIPFFLTAFWITDYSWAPLLCTPLLLLAHSIIDGISNTQPSTACNKFLEKAALLHLTFGACMVSIFFWL